VIVCCGRYCEDLQNDLHNYVVSTTKGAVFDMTAEEEEENVFVKQKQRIELYHIKINSQSVAACAFLDGDALLASAAP